MGQLDEAIRAHLELKRKHGASEEVLQAEEQEALGPVRREPPSQELPEPDATEDALPEPDPAGDEAEPAEPYPEPLGSEPPPYLEALEEAPPETFHESADAFVEPGFEEPAGAGPETVDFSEGLEEMESAETHEPLAPVEPEPEPLPADGDTPPRGFQAVEDPAPEEGDAEDVLEETPDFLQETPEHDRLWFEQKPPRDFDFDE